MSEEKKHEVSSSLPSELRPVATVAVSRATAQEEMVQVSVNVFEVTEEAIYAAVQAAGNALVKRVKENNEILAVIRDPIPSMRAMKR
jgi:hypothetical protein